MSKTQRIIVFTLSMVLLLIVFKVSTGNWTPGSDTFVILFTSLIMLSFVSLFLERFFTTPTDVLANTISILLLLSPIRGMLLKLGIWYEILYGYNILLTLTSLLALLLLDVSKATTSLQNRWSLQLKRFSTFFGNGRFLYFCLFILTLLFYVDSQTKVFLWLFFYAAVIILVDPKKFIIQLTKGRKTAKADVGQIFGVQSKNTYLAKLFKERVAIQRFDCVEFLYTMGESQRLVRGLVIDTYYLNEEQWAKILSCNGICNNPTALVDKKGLDNNVVYKVQACNNSDFLSRFIGVVIENSDIEKIRFEYGSRVPVFKGNLLEVQIGETKVLYQVVQGITGIEPLEKKNEASIIVGEAIQLGVWCNKRRAFEKYGWVPEINSPVLSASIIEPPLAEAGEQQIGTIPNTNYPILMNISDAIRHHIAILGITGSGKSVFARNLIREIIPTGIKIICVDFTNEYGARFGDLQPIQVISDQKDAKGGNSPQEQIFGAIDELTLELSNFKNKQNAPFIADKEQLIHQLLFTSIQGFLQSDTSMLALFELPDVSNTTAIFEYTRWFFKVLFEIAKKHNNFGKRLCIVLEEAHTVIPEWNFNAAGGDKYAGALVNSISQIALQGRKYNVGFIVIAQRTANVSKTVLTQCNSIIAFQQFDNTSREFLGNYMGTEMVDTLPNLKFRQAIAVGKGFRTGIPIIFEVPEIQEPDSEEANENNEDMSD